MAKQLNVELSFTADTGKAKQQIEQLQQTLQKLSSGSSISNKGLGITKDIQEGMQAASKLQAILQSATNTTTGKLDLTKFTQSLNASNMDLTKFRTSLEKLGPQGSQAFLQLARSISNADAPLMSINKRFGSLLTTLKNTAKWQISSSILHGFIGAVQGAFRYAQDLNESLNNIRIRTGQSTEEMARFAEQASRTAKALSTTTTDYTNAALIYYQQGLDDQQVKERTDITVKMANVTRDSAETVSQQLTAVWNNFDKGGQKLEYIADVMNALGAATASSTSEIATGLQKFAAAADAAGLSYEYAASALATITATTRQSADTVGTGLRTVLARIESLNLGETLEDGVGLTKYTKALESIGVQVLDTNGQLKRADDILNDMAAKWSTLTEAQKMATAETVGGVRQYTTIMALMENWDFMQKNLDVAYNSGGTLQEQADIYAESWEAAQKRVKAAAQKIYDDLIDDKFFITILNGAEKILTFIDNLIQSLGGLPGLLSTISTLVFKIFGPQIAQGMTTAVTALKQLTPAGQAQVVEQKNMAWTQAQEAAQNLSKNGYGNYGQALSQSMSQEASIQQILMTNAEKISDLEKQSYEIRLDGLRVLQEQNVENAKNLDILEQSIALEARKFSGKKGEVAQDIITTSKQFGAMSTIGENFSAGFDNDINLNPAIKTVGQLKQEVEATQASLEKFGINDKKLSVQLDSLKQKISSLDDEKLVIDIDDKIIKSKLQYVGERVDKLQRTYEYSADKKMGDYINDPKTTDRSAQSMERMADAAYQAGEAGTRLERTTRTMDQEMKQLGEDIINSSGKIQTWASNLVSIAGNISGISMGINSVIGSINTFKQGIEDGNLSLSNMLSMIMSLSMGISMFIPSFQAMISTITSLSSVNQLLTSSILAQNSVKASSAVVNKLVGMTENEALQAKLKGNAIEILRIALGKEDIQTKGAQIAALLGLEGEEATETGIKIAETAAQEALNIATMQYLALALLVIVAIAALAYGFSKLIVSSKEARQSMEDSNKSYEEAKNKLQELQNELDNTSKKIDELQSKGALNLVEQRELNQLKAREASLQRQVELQERLVKMEQESNARNIMKNFNSAYGDYQNSFNGSVSQIQTQLVGLQKMNSQGKYEQDPEEWFKDATKNLDPEKDAKMIESLQQQLQDWQNKRAEILLEHKDELLEAEQEYLQVVDALEAGVISKNDADVKKYLESNIDTLSEFRKAMAGSEEEYASMYLDTALDSMDNAADVKAELFNKAMESGGELTAQALTDDIEQALLYAGIKVEDFINYINGIGFEAGEKKNQIKEKFTTGDPEKNKEMEDYLNGLSSEQIEYLISLDVENIDSFIDLQNILDKVQEQVDKLNNSNFSLNWSDNQKTIDSIQSGETKIDAEAYAKLGSVGEEYFSKTYDGMYQLVGVASEFEEAIRKASMQAFEQDISDNKQGYNQTKGALESGDANIMIDNLEENGSFSTEQIEKWREAIQKGGKDAEEALNEVKEASLNLGESFSNLTAEAQNNFATACTALEDLFTGISNGSLTLADGTFNLEAYNNGLISLGSQHENCTTEVERFTAAIDNEKQIMEAVKDESKEVQAEYLEQAKAQKESAEQSLLLSVRAGELGEEYGIAAEEIEEYAKQLKNSNKYAKVSGNELAEMAKDQLRFDRAVTSTTKNLSKWQSALKAVSKGAMMDVEAMGEMREAYGDLLDMDPKGFSEGFLKSEKNLQLLNDAINGVDGAYEELQQAAQDDLNVQLHLDGNEDFLNKVQAIEDKIAEVPEGMDISAHLNDEGFLEELTNLVNAAGMTAEEATNYLSSMGIDAEVETVPASVESVPTMEDYWEPAQYTTSPLTTGGEKEGRGIYNQLKKVSDGHWVQAPSGHTEETSPSAFSLKVTSANKSSGGGMKFKQSAPAHGSGGKGGGGGGGGGNQKANPPKASNEKPIEVERYKEITDSIEDLSRVISDANTESDRLWGKDRLQRMEEANELLEKQVENYQKRIDEAKEWQKIDADNLQKSLSKRFIGEIQDDETGELTRRSIAISDLIGGMKFTFDKDGSITNYTEVMTAIQKKQKAWLDKYNSNINPITGKAFATDDDKQAFHDLYLEPLSEALDELDTNLGQYDETVEKIKDDTEALREHLRELQDNTFAIIETKLDLKIGVNESELEKIEYYTEKLADDFYSMGENFANYVAQTENAKEKLSIYKDTVDELTTKFNEHKISQEDYYETLKDIQSNYYEQIATLKELDTTMREYFGETLSKGQEELEKYTDNLDHVNDMLDHYKTVMQLLGKEIKYDMIGNFLDGIAKNSMNNYLIAKSNYDLLKLERERVEGELANLSVGTEEYKFKQKQLDDLVAAFNDAEDTMLDKAEEAAEAFKTIWENAIESIKHQFEMLVTGNLGFDFFNSSLERLESRQDEYLTKTNQLYEMNDLLRKLQADSDKTNNLAAKQRIANFSAEMEQLRDKNELSNLDLDIAKARYQQLIAQIALEEAQNAKSTVRLHRDNEGNYGYMYTADPDKLNEAEDALNKANNDLYNIVLEGTNKYSQLSLDLVQQFIDERADLETQAREEGWFETDRYYDSLLILEKEYYAKAKAYATEYGTAYFWLDRTDVSATGAGEAYTQHYQNEILQAQDFFLNSTAPAYKEMGEQMQTTTDIFTKNIQPLLEGPDSLSSSLGTVEQAVADNVERSNEWTKAVIGEGGLVDALSTEFSKVLDETNNYLKNHQAALFETISLYETWANDLADIIKLQAILIGDKKQEELNDLGDSIEAIDSEKLFDDMKGYDTGGYTGSWGSFGKIALLHEKELVLNKQDTENLLLSVDILRRLSSALDLQAMSSGLASISSSAMINAGSNNLQQDVTIHAEFPNAVDHTEIEMAFDTLINRASQYAGR